MKRLIGTLLVGSTAFTGGLITAWLLAPKSGSENRKWISNQTKDTKAWLGQQSQRLKEDGEKRIDRVSKGIKKTVKDAVPDLYEATEKLHFSEEEGIKEITKHG
jgi:gas vesicle protein